MEISENQPVIPGSTTPALEGAPCSLSHENRSKSVICTAESQSAPAPLKTGEEGSPSKP